MPVQIQELNWNLNAFSIQFWMVHNPAFNQLMCLPVQVEK